VHGDGKSFLGIYKVFYLFIYYYYFKKRKHL